MRSMTKLGIAVVGLAAICCVSPADASLIGETFNANVTISGSDDNGPYTIDVFSGAITGVVGPEISQSVFKQLTFGGFHTASNQITGTVTVDVTDHAISINFSGQAQPFVLESVFTGIPDTIIAAVDSATGIINGVNMDLSHSFTAHSVSAATSYFGFQPGTNVTQTETLTLLAASSVPEPTTFVLFCTAVTGLALMPRRTRSQG